MPQWDFPRLDPGSRRKTKVPVAHFAPRSAELGVFGDLGSPRMLLALLHVFFSPFQLQPRAPGMIFLAKTAFFGFSLFSLTLKAWQGGCFFSREPPNFPICGVFASPSQRVGSFFTNSSTKPLPKRAGSATVEFEPTGKRKNDGKTPVSCWFCVFFFVFPFPVSARFQVKICTDPSA